MIVREITQVKKRYPKADEFVKMFMMPGVLHCAGGPGPDTADWAAAIDGWVESGKAPQQQETTTS